MSWDWGPVIPPEWRWIKKLKVGDVVKMRSGRLRVVRHVKHSGPSLGQTGVAFVIAHKSWTNRPYTVINGNDMRHAGYRPTRARYPLDTEFDKLIADDINSSHPDSNACLFHAKDVIGIP